MYEEDQNVRSGNRLREFFNTGVLKAINQSTPQESEEEQYLIPVQQQKPVIYGVFQPSLYTPPDQLKEDDPSRYSIRSWWSVIQANIYLPFQKRRELFQRAVKMLPYSYKIWYAYLTDFADHAFKKSIFGKIYQELNSTFEQCLKFLPKLPRIWLMYCQILARQHLISKVRRTYNWALRNLPLTQHKKVWKQAMQWAMSLQQSQTAIEMGSRFIMLEPDFKDNFLVYLKEKKQYRKAVQVIQLILQDSNFNSKSSRSPLEYYADLADLVSKHSQLIYPLDSDSIIRKGIQLFPEDSGILWTRLAEAMIRVGDFEKARSIFQQALSKAQSAKNFGVIFNAYTKFEQEIIGVLSDQKAIQGIASKEQLNSEVQKRLSRLQQLLSRRGFIICQLNLRKDKNSVKDWTRLFDLCVKHHKLQMASQIIERARSSIDFLSVKPQLVGKMVVKFCQHPTKTLQEKINILITATQLTLASHLDHQILWVAAAQLLISQGFIQDAHTTVRHILFRRSVDQKSATKNLNQKIRTSTALWSLYLDIQNCVGTFQTLKAAYERCKQVRAITPVMLMNYADLLWDNSLKEQTFAIYQWGISHFNWPALNSIWLIYLARFTEQHPGLGLGVQRCRSLYEKVLRDCPQKQSRKFYFMYGQFQQQFGLFSKAVSIYDRILQVCRPQERLQNYYLYLAKVSQMFGITKTRAIFDRALEQLGQKEIVNLSLFYAQLQTKIGELERARKIYEFGSQFSDPRDDLDGIWQKWQKFQVQKGDKQHYKEYIRRIRIIQQKFSRSAPDPQTIKARLAKNQY